ncbi:ATP-binding protein [Shewanella pealeana]|uniref:Putative anti-sigma regulatory factor, serine/threonine protein kinase n=1 Tax=Shewanella pealeana (strain ATCC 700345 / ANG-SQ1) TaxID=398579 RepID=A8H2G9_SHEPA|nr:ATP-binding protein [Shewanella pealeana]ABV86756.1 putative anti-sigma regulatory factor, serine/threonine protein kinase [Shewanella pealeana ATCC 700345]
MNSLQFNLDRNIMAKHSISREIEQFMLQNQVSDTKRFKVITCVLEAVSNVFTHAAPKLNSLIIILHCDHQQIVIDLLDNSPMQPQTAPTDCPPANATSGRGLWIINNWMDRVRIQETVAGTHLQFSIAV